MYKKIVLTLFLGFISLYMMATDISVRIYADKNIKKFKFETIVGNYKLSDRTQHFIVDVNKGEEITIEQVNNKIQVSKLGKVIGSYRNIQLDGEGAQYIFKITPEQKDAESRYYDDHLEISTSGNGLQIINTVEIEHYVAGVVQSEVFGSSDDVDFFKIQAIISRTYAMSNMLKHFPEGYHLCDGVHCQVYKSRNNSPKILLATEGTGGLILVDENDKLISAAFHSNSGGQTINSEDVWSMPTPYLKSVTDTFSFGGRNSTWQKQYSTNEWFKILSKNYHYDINDSLKREAALDFQQSERTTLFCSEIPLKSMRKDLGLKSTFFSVHQEGDQVILDGKGYGHGVGLSQEGAIRMIKLGYSVDDILKYYYKNVNVVHFEALSIDDGLGD